jgi:hypothetical protein
LQQIASVSFVVKVFCLVYFQDVLFSMHVNQVFVIEHDAVIFLAYLWAYLSVFLWAYLLAYQLV